MARVEIQAADNSWLVFRLHVDSGSEITVMGATEAARLGLTQPNGNFAVIQGVGGGAVDAFIHRVQMRIGTNEFECRIAFATSDTVPLILGREDVFTTFKICYDDVKQRTEFHTRPQRRTTARGKRRQE
jgi:hypothetical protein